MNNPDSQPHLKLKHRLLMLLFNALPFLHIIVIAGVFVWPCNYHFGYKLLIAFMVLYLLPPLLARLLKSAFPIREGQVAMYSRDFFVWWALANLQMIFCRLPFLEECLRMLPGIYSLWLRIWGAKIGRFTYWSAGTKILDRQYIEIGDDVVFGAGVRINPHVIARNKNGEMELLLSTVKISDKVMVGGYSLLTAGTEIGEGETTRGRLISPPFTKWSGGKSVGKTGNIKDDL